MITVNVTFITMAYGSLRTRQNCLHFFRCLTPAVFFTVYDSLYLGSSHD